MTTEINHPPLAGGRTIETLLEGHERAILNFSGGKDSTALLYLCRPHLDRIEVVFNDAGATFPHVMDHIRSTCDQLGARLTVLTQAEPLEDYHRRAGLPSDVMPFWTAPDMLALYPGRKGAPILQEPLRCCNQRIFNPMMEYAVKTKATLILRGSKGTDDRVTAPDGFRHLGMLEIRCPLWDWTHDQVFDYLRQVGAPILDQYRLGGRVDSLDCWQCTAHLPFGGRERLAWMRENTPELYAKLLPNLVKVRNAVTEEARQSIGVIDEALRPFVTAQHPGAEPREISDDERRARLDEISRQVASAPGQGGAAQPPPYQSDRE